MEEVENKSRIKTIYWVIALVPIVFINLSPYLGIDTTKSVENDEDYFDIVLGFSMLFSSFLLGLFASFKCIVYSEIMPTKIIASLFLLLYLILILAMIYFYLN